MLCELLLGKFIFYVLYVLILLVYFKCVELCMCKLFEEVGYIFMLGLLVDWLVL